MPKIPQYSRQVSPRQTISARQATAADFNPTRGAKVSDGMASAGEALISAGEELYRQGEVTKAETERLEQKLGQQRADVTNMVRRQQDRADEVSIKSGLIQFESKLNADVTKIENSPNLDPKAHVQNIQEIVAKQTQDFISQFDNVSSANQQALQLEIQRLQARNTGRAVQTQAVALARQAKAETEQALGILHNSVRDGGMSVAEVAEKAASLVAAAQLPAHVGRALLDGFKSGAHYAQVEYELKQLKTPEDVVAYLPRVEALRAKMTKEDYDRALDAIDAAKNKLTAKRQALLTDEYKKALFLEMKGEQTSITEELVRASTDDRDLQQKRVDALKMAKEEGERRRMLVTASPGEARAMVQQLRDIAANEDLSYDVRANALEQADRLESSERTRQTAIKTGSVQYVHVNMPGVKKAYGEYLTAANAAHNAQTESHQSALNEAAHAKFNDYVIAIESAKVKLGVTDGYILPVSEAKNIQAAVDGVDRSEKGAEQLVRVLDGYARKYGANTPQYSGNWTKVYRQLVSEENIKGAHVALARIAGDPMKRTAAIDLARAINFDEEEIIRDKIVRDKISVAVSGVMEVSRSINATGDFKTEKNYHDATMLLASYYVRKNRMDPSEAAEKAYDAIIGQDIAYSGPTYYIPKSAPGGSTINSEKVQIGVRVARSPEAIVALDIMPAINRDGTLMDENDQAASIAEYGWFVNAPNGDGLMMMDGAGSPVRVKNRDGEYVPHVIGWEDLQSEGLKWKAKRAKIPHNRPPPPKSQSRER
jgi:hypothetical protein